MARSEQERRIEARLGRKIADLGGVSWKINPVRGAPDRIVLVDGGRCYFVEVKKPGGRLAPAQKYVQACLKEMGHRVYTLWSDEDVDAFIEDVTQELREDSR